ncbi:hypothetical protein JOE65_001071 [Arthrobacter roseus]|nr:hypothetical protein [Arthrobacter roseus]
MIGNRVGPRITGPQQDRERFTCASTPWSGNEISAWSPKPFFQGRRASYFSEWEFKRDASKSIVRGFSNTVQVRA